MKQYYCIILIFFCTIFTGFAQQDSTKNKKKDSVLYGPNTARYFYEEDIFVNRSKIYRTMDTAITNLHRYSYLQRQQNMYQDAGNMGTPLRSIFYQSPEQIGTNLGYAGYDLYVLNPKQFKYYNTMSPMTDVYVAQGGNFRSIITVRFARNITPLWNVGIFYHRVGANKIYGKASQRNDPQTLLNNYGLHTSYFSKNQRYKLLANFTYYDQTINENGGYIIKSSNIDSLFTINDGGLKFNLEKVVSTQNRRQLHIYQQMGILDTVKFQVFHTMDYATQFNTYIDQNFAYKDYLTEVAKPDSVAKLANNMFYYANFTNNGKLTTFNPLLLSSAELPYTSEYTLHEQKVGLKGRFDKFLYVFYAQMRSHSFSQTAVRRANDLVFRDTSITRNIPTEYFVGGNLRYDFNDSMRIDARLDYLVGGDYKIRAVFQRGLWQAGYERTSYRPTLLQRQFYNVLIQWNKTFVNTEMDKFFGAMELKLPIVQLNPYASVINLKDLVYYDQKAVAQQNATSTQLLQIGLNTKMEWRKWNFIGNFIYTKNTGADIFRVPTWFVNAQFFYQNNLFKSALFAQFGIDTHWKSAYYANSYMPVTQEYFLQDKYLVENYWNVDFFTNFKIKRVLLFIKVNNMLQNLVSGNGYYNTPVYIGQARGVELGVNWLFFD